MIQSSMGFFQIHVEMHWWIISQFLGVAILALTFYTMQQKSKSRALYFLALTNGLGLIANIMIANMAAVAVLTCLMIQNATQAWMDTKKEKITLFHKWLSVVVFFSMHVVAMYIVWHFFPEQWTWFNILLSFAAAFAIYVKAFRDLHWLRWTMFSINWLIIVNAAMFANIMAIIKSLVKITAVLVYYIRRRNTEAEEQS